MNKTAFGISLLAMTILSGCAFMEAPSRPETPPSAPTTDEKEAAKKPESPAAKPADPPPAPAQPENRDGAVSAPAEKKTPPPPPEDGHAFPPAPADAVSGGMRSLQPPPPPPPPPPAPPHPRHSPDHYRRGQGIWRAFSQLSDAEKKELLELQRTSPDKFRAVMQEKADLLYEKERARKQQMDEIAKKCRENTDPAEKAKLKAQLHQMVQEDFNTRLQNARRNLEEGRRRLQRTEADLNKREANSAAIIDTITEKMLE